MSLIAQQVQKAIERCGAIDLTALREKSENGKPIQLASNRGLEERRRFLQDTLDDAVANVKFERIIQGNELQDVNYLAKGTRAAKSIGRIIIREPNGRAIGYGTGFLIGPNILLTNNHVLEDSLTAGRSEIQFEYEKDESGKQLQGVVFGLEPLKLFFTNEALDFSVVAVSSNASNSERTLGEFGFLPLIGGTGKAVEGEWLTIIQHPGGELKQVCVRENQLLRKSPDVLWYSTDTQGGASGSPVFNNDWIVVALHHSGVPDTKDGQWLTIDGQIYDRRIHREEDIKWLANEGIRTSRIVETLEREVGANPIVSTALNRPASSTIATLIPPQPPISPMSEQRIVSTGSNPAYLLTFDERHNPVLTRVQSQQNQESLAVALEQTRRRANNRPTSRGVPFRFDDDYSKRKGFDVDFLCDPQDKGKFRVHLPELTPALAKYAVRMLPPDKTTDYVLKYTGMSLVMHEKRRLAIYSAGKVDFANRYAGLSSKRVWRYDPRIPLDLQTGDEAYAGNLFDRGHLTRQEDMEYGETIAEALQSTADTCHWTNCILQHEKFNQSRDWWQGMERHLLEHSVDPEAKGFRAQIFTGPIFTNRDPEFKEVPDIKVPMKFWKVAAAVNSEKELFAVAYLLDQSPLIKKYGLAEAAGEVPFEPYKLFQLPISELEAKIQLKFTYGPQRKPLSDCDPLRDGTPPELDADQDGTDDRLESAGFKVEAPKGWIDLDRHRPYFG